MVMFNKEVHTTRKIQVISVRNKMLFGVNAHFRFSDAVDIVLRYPAVV